MAMIVLNHYLSKTTLVHDFKSFLVHDGVLSVAGGIVIGITSAAFIKNLAIDIFLPTVYIFVFKWMAWVVPTVETSIKNLYGYADFQLVHFLQELIIWIVALISTFLVLEFIVRRTILKDRHEIIGSEENAESLKSQSNKLTDAQITSSLSSTLPTLRPDANILQSFSSMLPPTRVYI